MKKNPSCDLPAFAKKLFWTSPPKPNQFSTAVIYLNTVRVPATFSEPLFELVAAACVLFARETARKEKIKKRDIFILNASSMLIPPKTVSSGHANYQTRGGMLKKIQSLNFIKTTTLLR